MTNNLTQRQELLLSIITKQIQSEGRSPSIPELMGIMQVSSPNGIAKHLHALEIKGYITRDKGARGIRLTRQSNLPIANPEAGVSYVPLVGDIAAGSPILAQENIEEIFAVPESMTNSSGETFFLRVKGESMIEEGILPGDLVMIKKCDSVSNGELAAVLVDDEATVKRFYKEANRIVLQPSNKDYEPIIIEAGAEQCSIIGKVIGLMRSYMRPL